MYYVVYVLWLIVGSCRVYNVLWMSSFSIFRASHTVGCSPNIKTSPQITILCTNLLQIKEVHALLNTYSPYTLVEWRVTSVPWPRPHWTSPWYIYSSKSYRTSTSAIQSSKIFAYYLNLSCPSFTAVNQNNFTIQILWTILFHITW